MVIMQCATISCAPPSLEEGGGSTDAGPLVESGDIVVSNGGSDVVVALNPDGSFKAVVYDVDNFAETVTGLAWMAETEEILVSVDGVDRVVAVASDTGDVRTLISNPNLAGTLRGLAQLVSGDLLVVETNNVERFNSDGTRVVSGGWPMALQAGGQGMRPLSLGGFVHCSSSADVVRTYSDAGVQSGSTTSGIPATTDAMDCLELSDGSIAATWSGTTDTVRIYPSDLGAYTATYANATILVAPTGIAERANGNLLVAEAAFHFLVELDPSLAYVGILGDDALNAPQFLFVVP
ncbi:MAG: hypothetical protein IT285_04780 [Bdellovibrionales bacterium]|nr:hypothetical protein [Bdellovibrionales bacterium]